MRIGSLVLMSAMALLSGSIAANPAAGDAKHSGDSQPQSAEVTSAVAHDTSPPLRDLVRIAASSPGTQTPEPAEKAVPNKPVPQDRIDAILATNPGPPYIPDPTGPGDVDMPAIEGSFDGLQNSDNTSQVYPPDTVGDVGPNHYVQMVNSVYEVFDKSGASLFGPANINTIWTGFGGDCEITNSGDPIVQYDQFADRWLVTQFAINGTSYAECVAISQTPDPTGAYHRYAFAYNQLPDYPKFGIWPDGYYVSYNMFQLISPPNNYNFTGAKVCALDRSAMLAGGPATQQCFDLAHEWSLLPSDADGTTPPPTGSPNYMLAEHWSDQNKLTMYKFDVDWANPANTTLNGPTTIAVNAFVWACLNTSFAPCVPQSSTSQKLDGLGNRLMYRLAYRNHGDHESLVANHSVNITNSQTGIGWYEIRSPDAANPVVHQQGTTADPNGTTYRWMGSLAQDKQGNMALGYSTSSSSIFPGVRYVGRLVSDPLNTMPQAESTIINGGGSQTGTAGRWGDYSSMNVDPLDDCTFWYTNEYLSTTSPTGWRTRIANFKYPGCTGSATTPGTSVVTAAPGDQKVDVSFTEAPNGGIPVTQYAVTASPGGQSCTTRVGVTPNPRSCTFSGLTNGQEYSFSVVATNAIGDGPAATANATPRTVPGAPQAASATPGNTDASVVWSPPASDGSAAITNYTVTGAPGGATCTTSGTSCTVPGLTNGQAYTFTVVATNAAGDGPPSTATAPVTLVGTKQTAKVKTPKKIKSKGKTVLLKKSVKTNAGQKATAKVTVKPKGKKYAKVTISKKGKVTIKTTGKKTLKVTLKLSAPATDTFTSYSFTKKWKVKK